MAPFGIEAKSAKEYGLPEPDETGTTFEENAYLKAFAAAKATGLPALSDDSGLCVDALGGAPGVYTANWAEAPDGSRDFGMAMQRAEVALQEVGAAAPAQRKGRFVAVICLAFPDGAAEYFRGEVEGTLVWPPRGELGFGYDPVFVPDGFEKTFGEMTAEEKHGWKPGQPTALSHRARAFQKFAHARLDLARSGVK
jgi:XTP/dITP diphosphohydrolase